MSVRSYYYITGRIPVICEILPVLETDVSQIMECSIQVESSQLVFSLERSDFGLQ